MKLTIRRLLKVGFTISVCVLVGLSQKIDTEKSAVLTARDLELEIESLKTSFKLGEKIEINVLLANNFESPVVLQFRATDLLGGYEVDLEDAAKKCIPKTKDPYPDRGIGSSATWWIHPGNTDKIAISLLDFFELPAGKYFVTAKALVRNSETWKSVLVQSNRIEIQVTK